MTHSKVKKLNKWRFYRDDYFGDNWYNRIEISSPEFIGIPINDDSVTQYLLGYYNESIQHLVEIDYYDDYIQATLAICPICDNPLEYCNCDNLEEYCTYIGYHATKV